MNNCIYEGYVIHSRLRPRKHRFTYKVSYYFFDLENPPREIQLSPFLAFNPKNYLTASEVRSQVEKKTDTESCSQIKHIFILTQLSYFGFCFNPVSFYYCYNNEGELLYIMSLITNTPWGEKHLNFFEYKKTLKDFKFKKDFHVSPFMPMEIDYTWKLESPGDKLEIIMVSQLQGDTSSFFFAQMNLNAKELTLKNVIKNIIHYPIMSFKTIWGIYIQALILYLKKSPFYNHPKKREVV